MRISAKFYRYLLWLYPARFREEYESPMERQFLDDYRNAPNRWSRLRLWGNALFDVVTSAPGQVITEASRDLKHTIRTYRSRSISMMLAVIALSLAIGASTGIFSVLNALLIRGLPFLKPEELVELWLPPVTSLSGRSAFEAWYGRSNYLQGAAAVSSSEMNLAGERGALRVEVAEVSANFFSLLGVQTVAGRTFAVDEDIPGHNAIAVISYGLWQQLFAGDPQVVGRSASLNGHELSIIGVAPATFDYPGRTSIWTPTIFDIEKIPKRGSFLVQTIGRLKQGVAIHQARQMFNAEILHSPSESSKRPFTPKEERPRVSSLRDQLAGPVRKTTWVLIGMTLLVVLTACANVAQLILSRTTERRVELTVRVALGASRARLIQQLITEALSLTLISAGLGLIVAKWTADLVWAVSPAQLAIQRYTILDWRVLGFAAILAVMMGGVLGLVPAWLASRNQPLGSAMRNQSGISDLGTRRARTTLTVLQAALTLCLVTSAFALGHAFIRLIYTDLGFHADNVVTLNVSLQGTRHEGRGEWEYYIEALNKLRTQSEVTAAGAVGHLPLTNNVYMASSFVLDSSQTVPGVVTNATMPGYFRVMGTNVIEGRDFADGDGQPSRRVIIVNEAFAKSAGLGGAILGRKLKAPWSGAPYQIVGVVSTERFGGPYSARTPEIYWPVAEEPPPALTFIAKVRGNPEKNLALCRDAVRAIDPQVPIYDIKTFDQRLADNVARPRFYTTASGFLALLAALLAAVGIYGTTAHSIAQRRHEMGVRMAVGASYQRVREMMLAESIVPVVLGLAVGTLLSTWLGHYLQHLVQKAGSNWWISAVAGAFLLLAAASSSWGATARLLSIEPIEALRVE